MSNKTNINLNDKTQSRKYLDKKTIAVILLSSLLCITLIGFSIYVLSNNKETTNSLQQQYETQESQDNEDVGDNQNETDVTDSQVNQDLANDDEILRESETSLDYTFGDFIDEVLGIRFNVPEGYVVETKSELNHSEPQYSLKIKKQNSGDYIQIKAGRIFDGPVPSSFGNHLSKDDINVFDSADGENLVKFSPVPEPFVKVYATYIPYDSIQSDMKSSYDKDLGAYTMNFPLEVNKIQELGMGGTGQISVTANMNPQTQEQTIMELDDIVKSISKE